MLYIFECLLLLGACKAYLFLTIPGVCQGLSEAAKRLCRGGVPSVLPEASGLGDSSCIYGQEVDPRFIQKNTETVRIILVLFWFGEFGER